MYLFIPNSIMFQFSSNISGYVHRLVQCSWTFLLVNNEIPNVIYCFFSGSGSCTIDANFLTMATEDKKPETDTKPPVAASASASQSKVWIHSMFPLFSHSCSVYLWDVEWSFVICMCHIKKKHGMNKMFFFDII